MKGVAAAVLAALAAMPHAQQPPASTFRSTVDLVPVDVSVVDRNGSPVSDLTAQDFTLSVDGKPRRIASAQFVPIERAVAAAPEKTFEYTSNAGAATGRLIMLVIDSENIGSGRGRNAIDAARRFVGSLNRADRVALVVLPGTGPQLEFTSNHALVQSLLSSIVGQGTDALTAGKVGLSEAMALQRGDRMASDDIRARECAGNPPTLVESCMQQVMGEADQLLSTARFRTRTSLLALRGLFDRMSVGNLPKTIVLLSEGLVLERDLTDITWVATRAAAAQIILYVLHLDSPDMDAALQRMSPTRGADKEILRQGLYQLAGLARGDVFRVVADADFAFQRLGRELSGYYLLSFEPEGGDRDGKPHKIAIDVRRRDVQLRARREFSVGPPATTLPEAILKETLRAPFLANDIPLKLTTYTFRDPESARLKVIVAADVDRAVNPDHELALAYTMVDETGRPAASMLERTVAAPIDRERRQKYVSSAVVPPGTYTLKLAVVDDTGRRGSIERTFTARINGFGQLHVTDLLISDGTPGGSDGLTPAVAAEFTGNDVSAYVELFSDVPEQLRSASVVMEVAASETSQALDSVAARFQQGSNANRRAAEAALPIALLPPGEYVARAGVSVDGRKVGQVARPFRIARATRTATATAAAARPATPIAFSSRIDAFDKASVLTPQVVGFFLDRLSATAASSATAVRPALASVRAGRFDEAMSALQGSADDQLAAVFLKGLVLLQRGDLNAAAERFRTALRMDSEFYSAAFYLGACYAAGGRDREAAGAWQTALITESNAPFVYTLLGDALLRMRDVDQAVEILTDARGLWPGDDEVGLRLATALVMANKPAEALAILEPYLAAHPGDHERLFVALRAIYESRAAGRPLLDGDRDKALFTRYADAYAAARGPQQALVGQWRKFMQR